MTDEMMTIGQIADNLNEPTPRITYAISKYKIKPIRRVGILRIFQTSQLPEIKQCLSKLQKRRKREEV